MPSVLAALLVTVGSVLAVPASQGGYFPTSWGWSSLALLWIVALWAIVTRSVELGPLDVVLLGLLAALIAWIALSAAWSAAPAQTVLEVQRALVYLAGLSAFLLLARRANLRLLGGAALAAIVLLATYSLATRLFPDRIGVYDPIALYRLSEPLGYWNGLGIFCAMGSLLALGFVAHGQRLAARMGAAASVVLLLPTLYFTFSRGSWIALGLGLAAALACSSRRLRLATAAIAVAPASAAAVLLASQSSALTRQGSSVGEAAGEGHRLALLLVVLAAAAAAVMAVVAAAEQRVHPSARLRKAYAGTLVLLVVAAATAVFARYGSPPALAERGFHAFTAPPPRVSEDLNRRLFSFSGNGRADMWRVAWSQFERHPWLGSGAGSYERFWLSNERSTFKVRDAHGLYIETLAELGPLGLALLLGTLGLPVVAGIRARRRDAVAGTVLGAYAAFLAHAAVDWDWELSGVTLTALLLGALLMLAARPGRSQRQLPTRTRAAVLAAVVPVGAFAFVGLLGASALDEAQDAQAARRWQKAESAARRAERLMPWSSQPVTALGEAQLGSGDVEAARASFRRAVARDGGDWRAWLGLALATSGEERRRAAAHAHALNRHNPGVVSLRAKTRRSAR